MEDDKATRSTPDVESMDGGRYHPGPIKTGHNGIVLVPQPSDDPRDPLVNFHSLIEMKTDDLTRNSISRIGQCEGKFP